MNFGAEEYLSLGAGGVSFLFIIWFVHFLVTKLNPTLDALRQQNARHTDVIQNNNNAIKEMSRSNDNVANALSLLETTFKQYGKNLEKHEERTERIEYSVIRLEEKVNK